MEDKVQHNSRWTEILFQGEFRTLSKEEVNHNEAALPSIKEGNEINQKHTKTMERTENIEKKGVKMQNGGSSTKSKAKQKKERDAWMKENIIVTFHKWSEAERKTIMEKFGSLGINIKEESLMNDGKGKKKNVFLWDSESDEEDDDYPNPREEPSKDDDLRSKEEVTDRLEKGPIPWNIMPPGLLKTYRQPDNNKENFPTNSIHIIYFGFGDIGDLEEILIIEGEGGPKTNPQNSEYEGGEDDAHLKSEPNAP